MKEIALYGKGGIGKSTVSANISYSLGKMNKKVLQLGCDPKHDSTRFLLGGESVTTVLDYLRNTGPEDYQLGDIVHRGAQGVVCVEAGGPEPGVGCAGRGILSTFELLDELGLDRKAFDLVLYDVLGDVVCGGFAVPLRNEYAQEVYIVTSGEFMSLYAANNILKGLKNYSQDEPRAAGLIFNSRGLEVEDERVTRFAQAVGLPILLKIPRDPLFAKSEAQGMTLSQAFPNSAVAQSFADLGRRILHGVKLYPAHPLEEEELEFIIMGSKKVVERPDKNTKVESSIQKKNRKQSYYSKSLMEREPLHGCAYNGAMNLAIQLNDAITLSHGPKSCANLTYQAVSSLGRRSLLEKSLVLPVQLRPKIVSSNMGEEAMVFGGMEDLRKTLDQLILEKPELISIVTTCPSGIIGDDVESLIQEYGDRGPLIVLSTDGNINGDYMQGMLLAYQEIARQLVDRNLEGNPKLVNLYGEKPIANATASNIKLLSSWLASFGAAIHCRYLCNTSVDSVRELKRAGLHINAYNDYIGDFLRDFFKEEFDISFFPQALPIGFDDSIDFIESLGKFYDQEDVAEDIIQRERANYEAKMAQYRESLSRKKLMLISYNPRIDWLIRTALDAGMEVVKVALLNFSQDLYSGSAYEAEVGEWELDYDPNKRQTDIERLKPDLVISNYNGQDSDEGPLYDTFPLSPQAGFHSGVDLASRWAQLFRQNIQEGWRKDGIYAEKYQA